VENSSQKFARK